MGSPEHLTQETINEAAHEAPLSSQEVYAAVIKEALNYSIVDIENGARAEAFYAGMGVKRVYLERVPDVGIHRGWDADQTVQHTAAYKDRAAAGAMLAVADDVQAGEVASAGNAGAAYSRTAALRGLAMTVHCITTASAIKVERCEAYGAVVQTAQADVDGSPADYMNLEEAQAGAILASRDRGSALFHPFDQESVMAGNATVGFEALADLLEQQRAGTLDLHRDPVKLIVPVGGGGLIAGVATAIYWAKEQGYVGRDNVQVIGAQMEGCDAMRRVVACLRAGQTPPEDLFAEGQPFNAASDGTAVRKPGQRTLAIVADPAFVADIMLVPEGALGWEMRRQYERTGVKYEPAGMLARTAVKQYAAMHRETPETLISVTSGANVSNELFARMVAAGLSYKQQLDRAELAAWTQPRDALYALGGIAVSRRRVPTYQKPAANDPVLARQSPNKGRTLGGTFSKSPFGAHGR